MRALLAFSETRIAMLRPAPRQRQLLPACAAFRGNAIGAFPRHLPTIAQLAQLHKDSARIWIVTDVGKRLAQPGDDCRVLETEKGVDILFLSQCRDGGGCRRLLPRLVQQAPGVRVARFAIQGEFEIAREIFVSGEYSRGVRKS